MKRKKNINFSIIRSENMQNIHLIFAYNSSCDILSYLFRNATEKLEK